MKPYFVSLCSALKLLLAAVLLVLVSNVADAEMASIYGGRDGLCGHPTANGERLNCTELTAAHFGVWHACSRLPQRMCDGAD